MQLQKVLGTAPENTQDLPKAEGIPCGLTALESSKAVLHVAIRLLTAEEHYQG